MIIYINIVDVLMKDQIGSNLKNTSVINMKISRSKLRDTQFTQQIYKLKNIKACR